MLELFKKLLQDNEKEAMEEIVMLEKEHGTDKKNANDYVKELGVLLYLRWTVEELRNCVAVGYSLIATYKPNDVLVEAVVIDNLEDFDNIFIKHQDSFRPRYVRYKNRVHIHIEHFNPKSTLPGQKHKWTNNIKDIHTLFYKKGRMTNAIYDKLMKEK